MEVALQPLSQADGAEGCLVRHSSLLHLGPFRLVRETNLVFSFAKQCLIFQLKGCGISLEKEDRFKPLSNSQPSFFLFLTLTRYALRADALFHYCV